MAKNTVESNPERISHNGQKARTEGEELAAQRRRIRRWHRKATIALGLEAVKTLLNEAQGYSKADTADEK